MVVLDDFVGQASHGAPDIVGAKQFFLTQDRWVHAHSFAASRGAHLKALGWSVVRFRARLG